jgi:DNA-binding NarL/FixJ family response regulator
MYIETILAARFYMPPLTIVICDDHNLTIDGLRVILSANAKFKIVGHANTADELFQLLQGVTPDILILDINLGKENGLIVAKKIKDIMPGIRILFLTMFDDDALVTKAKMLKANGYLTKSAGSQDLFEAMEGIMGDSFYENPKVSATQLNGFKKRGEFIERLKLTKRELEIISLVGKGKSSETISEQLFLSPHTVRTHKKNIMKKLELNTSAELMRYAIEHHLVD